jgi:putative transposase
VTGAAYGWKNPDRLAQHNGYRDRTWETVRVPSSCASRSCAKAHIVRAFSNRGELPGRRSRRSCRSYVHGVSTRSVDDLVKAMGMTGDIQEPSL